MSNIKKLSGETTTEIVRTFLSNVIGIDAKGMFMHTVLGPKRATTVLLLSRFEWLRKESLC